MPTSVRLDAKTESLVKRLARRKGQTKSEVIREALLAFARSEDNAKPQNGVRDARTPDRLRKGWTEGIVGTHGREVPCAPARTEAQMVLVGQDGGPP